MKQRSLLSVEANHKIFRSLQVADQKEMMPWWFTMNERRFKLCNSKENGELLLTLGRVAFVLIRIYLAWRLSLVAALGVNCSKYLFKLC